MKVLGVDYGERKIGLALSEGVLSEPFKIIGHRNWKQSLKEICEEEAVEMIVVGLSSGKIGEKQKNFAGKLAQITGLAVELQDETLTSYEAFAKMKQIGKKLKEEDAISAALILQSYLDK